MNEKKELSLKIRRVRARMVASVTTGGFAGCGQTCSRTDPTWSAASATACRPQATTTIHHSVV
jgi:hypothetical protein